MFSRAQNSYRDNLSRKFLNCFLFFFLAVVSSKGDVVGHKWEEADTMANRRNQLS